MYLSLTKTVPPQMTVTEQSTEFIPLPRMRAKPKARDLQGTFSEQLPCVSSALFLTYMNLTHQQLQVSKLLSVACTWQSQVIEKTLASLGKRSGRSRLELEQNDHGVLIYKDSVLLG